MLRKLSLASIAACLFISLAQAHITTSSNPNNAVKGAVSQLILAQQRAEQEGLQLVEGNGHASTKVWRVPAHCRLEVPEGPSMNFTVNEGAQEVVFTLFGDANILDFFVADTDNGTFSLKPKQGVLLVSHTPVHLQIQRVHSGFPNGHFYGGGTQSRIICLNQK